MATGWKGSKSTIAITASGTSDLIESITIREGAGNLWAEIENSAHKELDAFIVSIKPHTDAGWHIIANDTSDFTTAIQEPIKGAGEDFTSLAKSASGLLWMTVKGIAAVKFEASSASSSDTTVNIKWSVR